MDIISKITEVVRAGFMIGFKDKGGFLQMIVKKGAATTSFEMRHEGVPDRLITHVLNDLLKNETGTLSKNYVPNMHEAKVD